MPSPNPKDVFLNIPFDQRHVPGLLATFLATASARATVPRDAQLSRSGLGETKAALPIGRSSSASDPR